MLRSANIRAHAPAAVLIIVQAAALAMVARGGFFYQDDFLFASMARDAPAEFAYLSEGPSGTSSPAFELLSWVWIASSA